MAKRARSEDLFRESTMTFGEHLEELRGCLWRSVWGLVGGFLIGLAIGGPVVEKIQTPLEGALAAFYQHRAAEKIEGRLEEFQAAGYHLPTKKKDLDRLIARQNLMPEEVLVNPHEIAAKLKQRFPGSVSGELSSPGHSPGESLQGDLMPLYIWHHIADSRETKATALSAHEAFTVFIKAALVVGIVVASPWVFYQIWAFVAAGLYPREKRYIHVFLPISLGLFLTGASTAFFFVMEPVLKFLFSFNEWLGITPDLRISEWISFVLMLPLGFGISFQLPLVMLFLQRIGIFSVESYLGKWRVAILVIFVASMLLTPADPWSMLLMAIPLTGLYFLGILFCRFMPRAGSPYDESEEEDLD